MQLGDSALGDLTPMAFQEKLVLTFLIFWSKLTGALQYPMWRHCFSGFSPIKEGIKTDVKN